MIQTLSWAEVAKVVRPDRKVGRGTVNAWVRRGVSVSPAVVAAEMGCSAVPVEVESTGAGTAPAGVPAGVLGPGGRMYPPLTRRGQRAPAAVVAMAGMEAMLTKHVDTLDLLEERRAARRARELPGSATGA